MGIENAMSMIDPSVPNVLVPIIGMAVDEATRIEPAERIVGEEERTAEIHTEGQGDAVIVATVSKSGPGGEALVIDARIDGMG